MIFLFKRYEGSAWEQRFLPRLTSPEIEALPKDDALVVLSVGAVEQHGAHMPVMTDALIGEAVLTRTMELLPEDNNVWMIPPISYGKSNEHLGHAGTISLSATTLMSILMDIAVSLKESGFRRLLLINTHGGNKDLLLVAAREIRVETGLMVFFIAPGSLSEAGKFISEEESEYGIHAGEVETSLLLAIKENWVHEDKLVKEIPNVQDYKYLTMEKTIRFAWVMSDLSESGISGDATLGTVEKGELLMETMASKLAHAMQEICQFEIEDVRKKKARI